MAETGVLYIVSGPAENFSECAHSISTLKKYNPGLLVQVIVSRRDTKFTRAGADFVDVMDEPLHPLKAKVRYLLKSRFNRTLFLDADTEIRGSLKKFFTDNSKTNFAAAHDNLCDWTKSPPLFLQQESEDINTGLLYYDSSPAIKAYFMEWFELLKNQDDTQIRPGYNCDQIYFNKYLRQRMNDDPELIFVTLPNHIYNVRPWCWQSLRARQEFSKAAILHAHHLDHHIGQKAVRKIAYMIGKLRARKTDFGV